MTEGRDGSIADRVLAILGRLGSGEEILATSELFESGVGLDSMGFLELVLETEREFGVDLRASIPEDALASVGDFIIYVESAAQTPENR